MKVRRERETPRGVRQSEEKEEEAKEVRQSEEREAERERI